jgi:sn-glycerol 3-phosphate transport system substrate-binding protein
MLSKRFRVLSLFLVVVLSLMGTMTLAQSTKIQIKFWHAMGGDARLNAVAKLVADFEAANPDIEVTAEFKGSYADIFNATLLVSRQKTAPDIVQIYEVGSQLAIDSGVFVPIGDVIDDAGKKQLDDVIPTVSAYYSINGKYNSVPWNTSTPLLYYNKDILKAAGLDPEKPPATWADVMTDCKAIIDSKAAPKCVSFQIYSWFVEQWMALENQTLVNNDNGRSGRPTESNLDSPAAADVFGFYKALNDAGYYVYSGKLEDGDGTYAIFQSKQVAFTMDSSGDIGDNMAAAEKNGYTLGIGMMPINDKVPRNGNVVGGASLWLVGGHPDAETAAAAKFMLYLNAAPQLVAWHKASGYLPISGAAQKLLNDEQWFDQHPGVKVGLDQLNESKVDAASSGALIGQFQKVRDIVEQSIQAMLTGTMDLNAALADAKKRVDAVLADYNANFQ